MTTIQKPKMTCTQLTMAVMLNMLGSSIILMPTKLAEIGTMSILSWFVTITGATTIAYVFAKCGMFSRRSGGMGGYASYAFGKSGSFLANFSYGVSLIIANLTIAISIVGYVMVLFDWNLTPLEMGLASMAVIWLCSIPNIKGARFIGSLSHFASYGITIPIFILTVIGWNWFSADRYIEAWNPQNLTLFEGISAGISMTLWGFLGLETACANAEAVENPEKSVPRAMVLATIGAGVVYVLANNISFGIVDNAVLSRSTAPFGLVFATMFSPEVGKFIMALMALACAGCLTSWQFTIAEVFRVSAREGYFPKIFAKVTNLNVPAAGMVIILVLQSLTALLTVDPRLEQQFYILKDLAVVTNLVPYLLAFAAVNVIMHREPVDPKTARRTTIFASFASLYSLYALYACGPDAMLWGALATFGGIWLYGYAAKSLEKKGLLQGRE
ncbi:MAG: putrescine-ornithine antiporter [Sutterella sp.]|nr:putrescine-ornithine antiporter [Sutterella sp.]